MHISSLFRYIIVSKLRFHSPLEPVWYKFNVQNPWYTQTWKLIRKPSRDVKGNASVVDPYRKWNRTLWTVRKVTNESIEPTVLLCYHLLGSRSAEREQLRTILSLPTFWMLRTISSLHAQFIAKSLDVIFIDDFYVKLQFVPVLNVCEMRSPAVKRADWVYLKTRLREEWLDQIGSNRRHNIY
jgi:hypothetical protein